MRFEGSRGQSLEVARDPGILKIGFDTKNETGIEEVLANYTRLERRRSRPPA